MKALVYTGPHQIAFRDAPDPLPGNDEALVKVTACGICGSDMHGYHGHDDRRPPPLILGHEASGHIMTGPRQGERVTINPLVTCGTCDACISGREHLCPDRVIISMPARPGAMAELVRAPEKNCIAVPPHLDLVKAALAEPIAVGYHAVDVAVRALARPLSAGRCVVLGGGAIGVTAALCLALRGARDIHIAEPNAGRRATAAKAGPFKTYAPASAGAPRPGTADVVLEAVGAAATRESAFRLVRPGGVIVHIGLLLGNDGVDVRRLTLQEVTFVGTYCYTMLDFRETVAALASGAFGDLSWFEERPLSEGASAFRDIDTGTTPYAKIVLRP